MAEPSNEAYDKRTGLPPNRGPPGNQRFDQNNERFNNVTQTRYPTVDYLKSTAPQLGQRLYNKADATGDDGKGIATAYPNIIEAGHPSDQYYATKTALVGENGAAAGLGMAQMTDADINYINSKKNAAIEASFKGFLLNQMDLSSPEKQAYWQNKFPEVFEEKVKLAEQQLDLQVQLTKINIFGPRNIQDYRLLYAIKEGFITPPKGPLNDPDSLQKKDFHRGMFNIRKMLPSNDKETDVNWKAPLTPGAAGIYPNVRSLQDLGLAM